MAKPRSVTRAAPVADPVPDGRRERSKASRAAIIDAMVTLIRDGNLSPTADQVAVVARVGQRTVFRHFRDMEEIYREVTERVEDRVMPILIRPLEAADWQGRVREIADRRWKIYEELLPFRAAADLRRFNSDVLMKDYRRQLQLEWTTLSAILPDAVNADRPLAIALHLALSFHCWRRLREDEYLDCEAARAVIMRMVDAVLCTVETGSMAVADSQRN
ncbi:TetR/AcrR family transcriptional regulator [Sphingomonas sp. 37zxx]|uniref:TetR/AcrR family transcriptional regulator n=1 Tax=Sphingomonas sp. 37zxx TaxID=1550073 RepID=UPI00068EC6CC|nr:TetR/AcrR family transcriptional regulator [Sphingomonas sp. 37zxx]